MRVYLAGPINGCTDDECSTWRNTLKRMLPEVSWVDPMVRDYRGREQVAYREIVEGDKRDIDSSHIVLVNYVKPSVGTSMEVLYAWSAYKPVVVIAASDASLVADLPPGWGRREFATLATRHPDKWGLFLRLDGRDPRPELLKHAKPDAFLTPAATLHTEDNS